MIEEEGIGFFANGLSGTEFEEDVNCEAEEEGESGVSSRQEWGMGGSGVSGG